MTKRFKLQIPTDLINEPIIYKMVTQYSLIPVILEAQLNKDVAGELIVELTGKPENLQEGLLFLNQKNITVIEI